MMSTAVRTISPPIPRYGSAAQLATYSGLSVKTIRRMVDAGKVRGLKVGSRLLIPFEDLDKFIQEGPTTMAIADTPAPTAAIDPATGRLLPQSDAQRKARSEALGRALDAMAAMTDEADTDLAWRDVFRGIDESRPHRPLFEGQY
jgi:excisionase family DNA binding protein